MWWRYFNLQTISASGLNLWAGNNSSNTCWTWTAPCPTHLTDTICCLVSLSVVCELWPLSPACFTWCHCPWNIQCQQPASPSPAHGYHGDTWCPPVVTEKEPRNGEWSTFTLKTSVVRWSLCSVCCKLSGSIWNRPKLNTHLRHVASHQPMSTPDVLQRQEVVMAQHYRSSEVEGKWFKASGWLLNCALRSYCTF